jgi:hypothetical protein
VPNRCTKNEIIFISWKSLRFVKFYLLIVSVYCMFVGQSLCIQKALFCQSIIFAAYIFIFAQRQAVLSNALISGCIYLHCKSTNSPRSSDTLHTCFYYPICSTISMGNFAISIFQYNMSNWMFAEGLVLNCLIFTFRMALLYH